MKKYLLTILLITPIVFSQTVKKDVSVYFNPAKLIKVPKGDAILFKYDNPQCKYVVNEPGAPVLPCMNVYVLMPKNAMFKSCAVRAEAIPLCGKYKLYCRRFIQETAYTAKRYPTKLAEFVGQEDIEGYRVFVFRTYPLTCQPGDNTVNKILRTSLSIKYYVSESAGLYKGYTYKQAKKIKKLVLNPEDLSNYSAENFVDSSLNDPLMTMRDNLTHEIFATKINKKTLAKCPKYNIKKDSVIDELMNNQVFIDDNDIVYAPITF